jgi:hypothetical protein
VKATGLSVVIRFDADVMVHGRTESMLAAQVLFCSLNADMAEQELNLFQFATGDVTQARTGPTKVVGRNLSKIGPRRKLPNHVPNHFLTDTRTPHGAVFGHATK